LTAIRNSNPGTCGPRGQPAGGDFADPRRILCVVMWVIPRTRSVIRALCGVALTAAGLMLAPATGQVGVQGSPVSRRS